MSLLLGCTHSCEQRFSRRNQRKISSKISDGQLETSLRIAATSIQWNVPLVLCSLLAPWMHPSRSHHYHFWVSALPLPSCWPWKPCVLETPAPSRSVNILWSDLLLSQEFHPSWNQDNLLIMHKWLNCYILYIFVIQFLHTFILKCGEIQTVM